MMFWPLPGSTVSICQALAADEAVSATNSASQANAFMLIISLSPIFRPRTASIPHACAPDVNAHAAANRACYGHPVTSRGPPEQVRG